MWNGSVLRGRLTNDEIGFQIIPGPALRLRTEHCLRIERSLAMPPDEVNEKVSALIRRLASDNYLEREKATAALVELGDGIIPVLKKRLQEARDPEVRQRIEEVIEKLGVRLHPAAPDRRAVTAALGVG
jgi:HEAT repeat protein